MPTAPTSVKDLSNLLVKSRLLSADDVKAVARHSPAGGAESDDLEAFRRVLILNKYLTDYQAALLMRGHSEGFFLGEYKILELLAKGRMAGVYKAVHASGQTVAIKVLPSSKAKNPEVLARFRREAKLLTRLDHPNVVRSFQIGEADGRHYLVLEYLDGDTLEDVLEKRKTLTPVEAVRIVHQALIGLQHIHERGLIHRDLKPANLMLVDTGGKSEDTLDRPVKILDIGLGKAVFDEAARSHVDDPTTLTGDGVLLGTPDYLAPEQARKASAADIRSDIYSLGCVLYQALTGNPPFPDASVLNTVMRHANEPVKPLAESMPRVPDGLQNVLNWMIAKDPAQRYATPDRAAQALHLFLKNTPVAWPAPAPLPAFVKYLESTGEFESNPPSGIPVGRLETAGRKPAAARMSVPVAAPADAVPMASIPQPAFVEAGFDVELIPLPDVRPLDDPPRGPFEFDRRDAIMLCSGGGLVLGAILLGYGVSRLMRKDHDAPDAELPKE